MASFQEKIGWEWRKKREKKIVQMSSHPTRNRELEKIAKIFKKLKNTIMASFQAKIRWERLRKRESKTKSFR